MATWNCRPASPSRDPRVDPNPAIAAFATGLTGLVVLVRLYTSPRNSIFAFSRIVKSRNNAALYTKKSGPRIALRLRTPKAPAPGEPNDDGLNVADPLSELPAKVNAAGTAGAPRQPHAA